MQGNLLKLAIIMLLVIGITGCAETVSIDTGYGIESIKVISDIWYYIRWGLGGISAVIGIIIFLTYLSQGYDQQIGLAWFLGLLLIAFLFSFGLIEDTFTQSKFATDPKLIAARQRYQEALKSNRYELKAQIRKAQTSIDSLKQDRDQKVFPLKQNYSQMYDQYYPQLAQQLPETGIRNHEELLKNCEQYLELCSSLNRVAKLQYYISKLDDKLKQIGANIIKLDDNVWNMERTFELSQIFSDEELEGVERLIKETEWNLKD